MWSLWGFPYIVSCHLHVVTVFPLPFQFGYLLFLFLVWLLWLGFPILCLNRSDETGHQSLFPEFSLKALSFSPLCIMLAVGLSQVAFMMLILLTSVRVFILKGCWILPNTFLCIYWNDQFFSASIEMIIWLLFLLLLLLMWCIMLIDLHMLNQACDPGMNPTWSWHVILLVYCWVLFTNILLKIFASNFIKDIDP